MTRSHFFRALLAQHSVIEYIRVISTPNASLFGSKRIVHSINLSDVFEHAQRVAGRVHAVLVRAARRVSGNFAISSGEFGAKLA